MKEKILLDKLSRLSEKLEKEGFSEESNWIQELIKTWNTGEEKVRKEYAKVVSKKISERIGEMSSEIQELMMDAIEDMVDLLVLAEEEAPTLTEIIEAGSTKI